MENQDLENNGSPPFHRDPHVFTITAVAFELLLIPMAWFLEWVWQKPEPQPPQWNLTAFVLGILATSPLVLALALLTWTSLRDFTPVKTIRERLRDSFGNTLSSLQPWQIVAISLAAGFGEEILFRGTLQQRVGTLISAILFGALHWVTFTYAVLAAILGAYLSLLFLETGNLLVPVIVHSVYDLVALLVVRRELRKEGYPKQAGQSD